MCELLTDFVLDWAAWLRNAAFDLKYVTQDGLSIDCRLCSIGCLEIVANISISNWGMQN
jgi:hypothetical protein